MTRALRSITPTELQNDLGDILSLVTQGHSFVIINEGGPIAHLEPLQTGTLVISRPARREGGWRSAVENRRQYSPTLIESLEDLRQDRI